MTRRTGLGAPHILIAFLIVSLIWSSTWIVIKDQLGIVPPVWSVSYRFLIASAAMFLAARLSGIGIALGSGGHRLALALGIAQFVLNYNFVYAAELHITSGLVAVVFALLMVPNALFDRLFFGQRASKGFLAGSAVAIAGVALLFVQEFRQGGTAPAATLTGLGFSMIGLLAASASNVMQLAEGMKKRPVTAMLAWAMLYGALIDMVYALATEGPPVIEARIGYWLGLFYLGLVGSSIAFLLYFRLIRDIGPGKAAYSGVLVPVLAMAISTVVEGYRWSTLALAGGALALAGMVIALRAGRPEPVVSPTPR